MSFFGKKKPMPAFSLNPATQEPAVRKSICTGEMTVGYIDKATGKVLIEVDPKYFRAAEVEQLLGDPSKAKERLGWNPRKTSFEQLVKIMVDYDLHYVTSHENNR